MKKRILFAFAMTGMVFCTASANTSDKDSLGLPGDYLDLYATLELFKKSSSLEEFEKSLNSESNKINNLDLDGDGKVDYISVIDKMEDEAHAIKLQVAISKTEAQDVAVIEMEKVGNEKVNLQIVGDEDMYGKDYIVEPKEDGVVPKSSMERSDMMMLEERPGGVILFNVWFWPCVKFMYAPAYVVWASPWYWGYYPMWWSPWGHRHHWGWYHNHHHHHHGFYHRTNVYRMHHAHKVYHSHRKSSPTIYKKHHGGKMKGNGPGPNVNKNGPKVDHKGPGPKNKGGNHSPSPQKKNNVNKGGGNVGPKQNKGGGNPGPKPNKGGGGGGGKKGGGGGKK